MLELLKLKNFGVVDSLELEFQAGLNVITGETGAGKSLVLKALELLTGKRASSEVVKHGTKAAEIEAIFGIAQNHQEKIRKRAESLGYQFDESEFLIRRIIDQSGRSKTYLNGSLLTLNLVSELMSDLVDITSQHQQQNLLDNSTHRELLDSFGVSKKVLEDVAQKFIVFSECRERLRRVTEESEATSERLRRVLFERDELAKMSLEPNERENLEADLKKLASLESLSEASRESLELIEKEEAGLESMLLQLSKLLSGASSLDENLKEGSELVESASAQISELRFFLADYLGVLEEDPEKTEQLRERLADLARLERKYGKNTEELIEYLDSISQEIAEYEAGSFDVKKLEESLEAAQGELKKSERELSAERRKIAKKLERRVEKELAQLNIKRARFEVRITPKDSSKTGADDVEFFLTTNPGQPFKPLSKVASGGELSRILLVLKTLLGAEQGYLLQVFDEIDSGVGGEIAQVVGEKLRAVSERSQTIVVTHSPQVAAAAANHLLLEKQVQTNSTSVNIKTLDRSERINEIARMLAGKKVSKQFITSAKELLKELQ